MVTPTPITLTRVSTRGVRRDVTIDPSKVSEVTSEIMEALATRIDDIIVNGMGREPPRHMDVHYDKELIVAKCIDLEVWKVVGYSVTMRQFNVAIWVPQETYAERVIRYLVTKCIEKLGPGNVPRQAALYEIACSEYFMLDDGLIGRVTRTRIRLLGERGRPTVSDYRQTIKVLVAHEMAG